MTDAGTNNGSVSSHEDDFVPKSKILFTCLVCLIYFLGHGKMQQIVFANEMFMQNIQTQFRAQTIPSSFHHFAITFAIQN